MDKNVDNQATFSDARIKDFYARRYLRAQLWKRKFFASKKSFLYRKKLSKTAQFDHKEIEKSVFEPTFRENFPKFSENRPVCR